MSDSCCPRWGAYEGGKLQAAHDPGCPYAEDTWPRVFIRLISAAEDFAEKWLAARSVGLVVTNPYETGHGGTG